MSLPGRDLLRDGDPQSLLALYASIIDELLERKNDGDSETWRRSSCRGCGSPPSASAGAA